MDNIGIQDIKTLSEFHKLNGLSRPEHPLISLIDYGEMDHGNRVLKSTQGFYSIAMKRNVVGKFKYGQLEYDFDEGLMSFFAPHQVLNIEMHKNDPNNNPSGWILLIHPDFLYSSTLAKTIHHYHFFDYSINEALFLSEKEERVIEGILQNINTEIKANIDSFNQTIIIAQIELLLSYSERYYQRQFITRKKNNHEILGQLEEFLTDYFRSDDVINKGVPTVQFIAENLNLSPTYLSSLLKSLTGQNTQQHIHEKLIEKAKEKLSTTNLSVSEIAYGLGYEHSQSFSKLFKNKTKSSPLEFRQSFN